MLDIIILGAGLGGLTVARTLDESIGQENDDYNVTLIDLKK